MKYYAIDEKLAQMAHAAVYSSDYRPGSCTRQYQARVDEAIAIANHQKEEVIAFYHPRIDALVDQYARRLAKWCNDNNRNDASCPSILVAGPANFPVRKKEKQLDRSDQLMKEWRDIENILNRIRTVGTGAVDLTATQAREVLTAKLQAVKAEHTKGKAMNAYYRKNGTMREYDGLTDEEATRMDAAIENAVSWAKMPCPGFTLTSLRNKAHRLEARLAELDKLEAAVAAHAEDKIFFDGGCIIHNAEQNRLQIVFDNTPEEATRAELKSHGFRWSPRNQAWQRQLTHNAEYDARQIVGLGAKRGQGRD